MIYDTKDHLTQYKGLSSAMDCAIDCLLSTDFRTMDEGRYPMDGDRVIALVQTPATYPKAQARWEAHRMYTDIQFLLWGEEIIGLQKTELLKQTDPYRADADITFFRDNGRGFFPLLMPGSFVVCFPTDAHMPLVCPRVPMSIKKVVVKVKAVSTLL